MRILICTDNFYPGIGGTEAAVLGYAKELVKEGHTVLVACPKYGFDDDRGYLFDIVRIPSLRGIIKNNPIALTHASPRKIRKLADFCPDIVHLETLSGMAKIGLRVGRKRGVPVVMTMHTKILDAYRHDIKLDLLARLFLRTQVAKIKRCDALVTVANCMVPEIKSYRCAHADDIIVIRNGAVFDKHPTDEEERTAVRRKLGIGAKENVLLFVGRLFHYKQVVFVLRSLKIAKDRGFRFKYLVVGDGDDAPDMRKEAQRLGLNEEVVFVGQVSDREQLQCYYSAADLFITASKFDTDPIVVLEAASKGVASLVSENTGCAERIIDGVNGFTAPFDVEAFAVRVMKAFSDKEKLREAGNCAADTVLTTWEDTVRAHMLLYAGLCSEKLNKLSGGGSHYSRVTPDSRISFVVSGVLYVATIPSCDNGTTLVQNGQFVVPFFILFRFIVRRNYESTYIGRNARRALGDPCKVRRDLQGARTALFPCVRNAPRRSPSQGVYSVG